MKTSPQQLSTTTGTTSAEERFDFQVRFDPLEENLDLPAGFVDLGDGGCGKREVVGLELDFFTERSFEI